MPDLTYFFIIQSLFDLLILVLVILLFKNLRDLKKIPLDEALAHLKKAHTLCERLTENLAEKKVLSERLLSALETGAKAWESSKSDAGALKKQVAQMAEQGLSVSEIAQKTGLQEGEVALILSVLEKKKS